MVIELIDTVQKLMQENVIFRKLNEDYKSKGNLPINLINSVKVGSHFTGNALFAN